MASRAFRAARLRERLDNQVLAFEGEVLGENRLDSARSKQSSQGGQQMREQRE
jgi:hypothetical protein